MRCIEVAGDDRCMQILCDLNVCVMGVRKLKHDPFFQKRSPQEQEANTSKLAAQCVQMP